MSEQQVSQLLAAAASAHRSDNRAEESRLIDAVLAIAPDHAQALNTRGMRALEARDYERAIDSFRRATAADPREAALWMNLATAYRQLGDDAGERASLDAAIAIDQLLFMAWLRKAELLQRVGEKAPATLAWQHALTLSQAIDPMPPALGAVLDQARAFVAQQGAAFAAAIDEGIAGDREAVPAVQRRRFDACIDHTLGRRPIYVNQCAGIHYPFLPADEFFDRAHFPWMAALEARTDAIRVEFEALMAGERGGFRPYVAQQSGTPDNKWSPLDGSLDWSAYFLWEYGVRNETACAQCPETAAALETVPRADIPGRAPTVFFSLLKPRTRIPPHTGVSNTRTIIHLPLIVPDGCGFRVGGETRQWRVGEALAFDDTIEHEAWNDSDLPRAVLIFDVWNPYLTETERRLLRRFFETAENSGYDPEPRAS